MASYLLDTHVLLWAASGSDKLSDASRSIIDGGRDQILFSVASLWEVVIKSAIGRADFAVSAADLRRGALAGGLDELAIRSDHVLDVADLPPLHGDPFDRILLSQARREGLNLLTADRKLLQYGAPTAPA